MRNREVRRCNLNLEDVAHARRQSTGYTLKLMGSPGFLPYEIVGFAPNSADLTCRRLPQGTAYSKRAGSMPAL